MVAPGWLRSLGKKTGRPRAIISDIHGNYDALKAVLADIEKQDVGEIICLGDVIGYGPEPIRCLKTVRSVCDWSLCGNHDAAVFMSHAIGFNRAASDALDMHRTVLRPGTFSLPGKVARWRWLENLPAQRVEGPVKYVHASPRDPLMEYVLAEDFEDHGFGPSEKARDYHNHFDWLCFVGHSHRPGVATPDLKWIRPEELGTMMYKPPKSGQTIINIGSVGQPRDGNPDSCYVLFDGETVRYRRVPYDLASVQSKIEALEKIDNRLADRLAVGK